MMLRLFTLALVLVSLLSVQAAQDPATAHYLAGEAAANNKDYLTAVIEWQTTLELKPSSAYTAKRLAEIKTAAGPGIDKSLDLYNQLQQYITQQKPDQAQTFVKAIQAEMKCTPQCLQPAIDAIAKMRQASEPAETSINLAARGNGQDRDTPPAPNTHAAQAGNQSDLQVDKICMMPVGRTNYGAVEVQAQGRLRNAGKTNLAHINLTIGYYDERGRLFESEMVWTETLAPGTTWTFKGTRKYYENPPNAKVKIISGTTTAKVDKIECSRSTEGKQSNGTQIIIH